MSNCQKGKQPKKNILRHVDVMDTTKVFQCNDLSRVLAGCDVCLIYGARNKNLKENKLRHFPTKSSRATVPKSFRPQRWHALELLVVPFFDPPAVSGTSHPCWTVDSKRREKTTRNDARCFRVKAPRPKTRKGHPKSSNSRGNDLSLLSQK